MEGGLDNGAYGGLFLNIMSDLRSSSPVWEDFCSKATKLHTSLKATLTAITAFLDAFQKVADMATGSKGATKEIGTSLTRLCMRHKAIEGKLKKFTGTILESLVNPLQECMEDWKKTVVQLDKERTKEYKKSKAEIKKCASDTVRLQKKVKKGKSDMLSILTFTLTYAFDFKHMRLDDPNIYLNYAYEKKHSLTTFPLSDTNSNIKEVEPDKSKMDATIADTSKDDAKSAEEGTATVVRNGQEVPSVVINNGQDGTTTVVSNGQVDTKASTTS